jgi:hypothetical protein
VKTIVVIIDGLGYDQVVRFAPRGLMSRAEQTGLAPLTTLLTYSSGIYPSIWTGRYPDEHDIWTEFYRRETPNLSPIAPLGLIPGKYVPRQLGYLALGALRRAGADRGAYYGIPPLLQGHFGRSHSQYWKLPPVEMRESSLISRVIESRGDTWEYVFCDALDDESTTRIRAAANRVDHLFVCFAEVDKAGHEYGPMTSRFGAELATFDERLERLLVAMEQQNPDAAIMMFSDHGMTSVTRAFDMWTFLERHGFKIGRDYLAFINSTIASLWFHHRSDTLVAALNGSGYGRVLRDEERAAYHVNFRNQRYGEAFFVADEGVELIPNFISLARHANRGMHGYDPVCDSTRAFFIGGEQFDARPRDVVGLYDVLVEATSATSGVASKRY